MKSAVHFSMHYCLDFFCEFEDFMYKKYWQRISEIIYCSDDYVLYVKTSVNSLHYVQYVKTSANSLHYVLYVKTSANSLHYVLYVKT